MWQLQTAEGLHQSERAGLPPTISIVKKIRASSAYLATANDLSTNTMAITAASKKRKVQDGMAGRIQPKKKFRKQTEYHSSTEDEDESDNDASTFAPVNLLDSDEEEQVSKSKATQDKNSLSAAPKKSKNKEEIVKEDDDIEDDEPDVNASSGDEDEEDDREDREDNDSMADDDEEEGGLRLKTVTKRHSLHPYPKSCPQNYLHPSVQTQSCREAKPLPKQHPHSPMNVLNSAHVPSSVPRRRKSRKEAESGTS